MKSIRTSIAVNRLPWTGFLVLGVVLLLLATGQAVAASADEESLLKEAPYDRRHDQVRTLLAKGVSPNAPVDFLWARAAIHLAAEAGAVKNLTAILQTGGKPDLLDNREYTPLHWASLGNELGGGGDHPAAIRLLVRHGADLHRTNQDGDTPLHVAVSTISPHIAVIKALLDAGAKPDAVDGDGWTALQGFAESGGDDGDIVTLLLKAGANPDRKTPDGDTPLHLAIKHGGSSGKADVVEALLDGGAEPCVQDDEGYTPYHMSYEMTRVHQALDRAQGFDASHAGGRGCWFYGGRPTAGALHQAVKAGDLDGVTRMLASGADVNARDKRGRTALMYAVDKGYVLLVEPLLAAKADPNVRAPDGATALFIAVAHGHSEIITMLKNAGADPTIKGPKGKTANDLAQARVYQKTPPGSVFRDCNQCPEMVVIPPGSFQMGDVSGEGSRDERPVHRVTIKYWFAVGKYEVTFDEWDACVAAGGCSHRSNDKGWGRGTRPVINVSWKDAQEYVQWLSRETGQPYRLLSEAEWEYVARAGTTTKYWWGNTASHNYANYIGADRWVNTNPVGSFQANALGVFDTAGNVWEWVEDCWNNTYEGAPTDGNKAWTSGDCGRRVVRGGSWGNNPEHVRPAYRLWDIPGARDDNSGFRIARTLIS